MDNKIDIGIAEIDLDIHNYRIGSQASQKDALKAIVKEQGDKLYNLAKDIVDYGINPADLPILIQEDVGDKKRYYAIEGNRRIAAIKIMINPEQIKGDKLYKSFSKLNEEHYVRFLKCFVASSLMIKKMRRYGFVENIIVE